MEAVARVAVADVLLFLELLLLLCPIGLPRRAPIAAVRAQRLHHGNTRREGRGERRGRGVGWHTMLHVRSSHVAGAE